MNLGKTKRYGLNPRWMRLVARLSAVLLLASILAFAVSPGASAAPQQADPFTQLGREALRVSIKAQDERWRLVELSQRDRLVARLMELPNGTPITLPQKSLLEDRASQALLQAEHAVEISERALQIAKDLSGLAREIRQQKTADSVAFETYQIELHELNLWLEASARNDFVPNPINSALVTAQPSTGKSVQPDGNSPGQVAPASGRTPIAPPESDATVFFSQNFLALIEENLRFYGSRLALREVAQVSSYAILANAAYAEGSSVPDGWEVLPESVRAAESLHGLSATVFRSVKTGEVVIAFPGTRTDEDKITDIMLATRAISAIPRFAEALAFGRMVLNQYPVATFTGHSLGGGLAQYLAASLGMRAIAFNPAPIRAALIREYIATPLKNQETRRVLAYDNIQNFRGADDPLTDLIGTAVLGPDPIVLNTGGVALWDDAPGANAADKALAAIGSLMAGALRYNHAMDIIQRATEMAALIERRL
jgi:hypothetical protein